MSPTFGNDEVHRMASRWDVTGSVLHRALGTEGSEAHSRAAEFLIGLLANMQEQDLWKQHRWPQLCPVIFHIRPVLVVMPRTVPLTTEQAASDAHLALLETDDGLFIPAEPKGDSFGVLDGRIVIVDYGDRPD